MRRPQRVSRWKVKASPLTFKKQAAPRFITAGDERMVEGQPSENNHPYPVMLREPYQFKPDVNEITPEEAIQSSGCQTISQEL
mgnify:FL=1